MMAFIDNNVQRSLAADSSTSESFVSCYRDMAAEDFDMDDLNIIIRDLIVAGTETSVTSIRWALIALANHRRVLVQINYYYFYLFFRPLAQNCRLLTLY